MGGPFRQNPPDLEALNRWLESCLDDSADADLTDDPRAARLLAFAREPLPSLDDSPLSDPDFAGELAVALSDSGELGPGSQVGPFRIERAIGAGGMGAVYLARRAEGGFDQQVALKVLTGARPDPDSFRQFQRERELLARLEHPGIARLVDGGMTEDLRPWFAMEYVEGQPIDRHADRHGLGVEARLELFRQVCRALEYAHGQLILHRDIKPSNILVTPDGQVKLLDFGLGRIQEQLDETDRTVTQLSARWLTPEYASPEQVRGEPVSVASEVYQLGGLLYRLLCDVPPLELPDAHPATLLRIICERSPIRPSERWRTGDRKDASARAEGFNTAPESLVRQLRGDLDNIVLMALAKGPERRYGSVTELEEDLQRHLEHRPVRARAGTRRYRLGKFLRRYRYAVATACSVFVLVSATLVVIALQAQDLARQQSAAERESERARVEAAKAGRVSDFLIELFESADPAETRGASMTVQEVLQEGVRRIDQLDEQPRIQAQMMDVLARVHRALGLLEPSRDLAERAVDLHRRILGNRHPDVAGSLDNLGKTLHQMAAYETAEQVHREALEIARTTLGPDHPLVASCLSNLGTVLLVREDLEGAETAFRRSLEIHRNHFGPRSPEVATGLNDLGTLAWRLGEFENARSRFQDALIIRRKELGEDHPLTLSTLANLAEILRMSGDLEGAERANLEVLESRRRVLGDDHPGVAGILYNLGYTRWNNGDLDGAEEAWRESVELRRQVLGENHPNLASAQMGLAAVARDRGNLDETERLLKLVLSTYETHFDYEHTAVAGVLNNLGTVRADQGDITGAREFYFEALEIYENALGPDHPTVANVLHRIGETYLEAGQSVRAEKHLARALVIREQALAPDHPSIRETRKLLSELTLSADP